MNGPGRPGPGTALPRAVREPETAPETVLRPFSRGRGYEIRSRDGETVLRTPVGDRLAEVVPAPDGEPGYVLRILAPGGVETRYRTETPERGRRLFREKTREATGPLAEALRNL